MIGAPDVSALTGCIMMVAENAGKTTVAKSLERILIIPLLRKAETARPISSNPDQTRRLMPPSLFADLEQSQATSRIR